MNQPLPYRSPMRRNTGTPALTGTLLILGSFVISLTLLACGDEDDPTAPAARENAEADTPTPEPTPLPTGSTYLKFWIPDDGQTVINPVTFQWHAGSGVDTVSFSADGTPLHRGLLPADRDGFTYDFDMLGIETTVTLTGYDVNQEPVASDQVRIIPVDTLCPLEAQPGFNGYVVDAINDWKRFPRDGTYPYCWSGDCGGPWGQIHDGYYASEFLFEGGDDCFCSGYTLELFLLAYRLFQADHGLAEDTLYTYGDAQLTVDEVDLGEFYQYWQGWGVTDYASAADALTTQGLGLELFEDEWDEVSPGDFVNIWRTDGSGHSVIFISWIEDAGEKIGLRYYSCNTSGETCPDSSDPSNRWGISGPSYNEEYFESAGGRVLEDLLFVGHAFLPDD